MKPPLRLQAEVQVQPASEWLPQRPPARRPRGSMTSRPGEEFAVVYSNWWIGTPLRLLPAARAPGPAVLLRRRRGPAQKCAFLRATVGNPGSVTRSASA